MINHKELVLGALLHDVGKAFVEFRVQNYTDFHLHPKDNLNSLKWKLKNLWKILKHNNIIDPFVVKSILFHHWLGISENKVKEIINEMDIPNNEKELLISYFKEIKNTNSKDNRLLKIISKVDKAISNETREESSENAVKIVYPWSIFKEEKFCFMFGLNDVLNPRFENSQIDMNEYRKEWKNRYQEKFLEELKLAYETRNPSIILLVLYKYLFFFPESLKDINEVSLAHHLKYTALLSDLYYKEVFENKKVNLIIIDVVGTHKFINSLLRNKKEIEERGKFLQKINAGSRFIEILTALVVAKVLEISNSYITNVINLSTNGATLLIALSENEKNKIEKWIKELNKVLFKITLGQLYVSIYFETLRNNIKDIIESERVGELIEWIFKNRSKELSERKEELKNLEFEYLDENGLILDIESVKDSYVKFLNLLLSILGRWIYNDKPIAKITKEVINILFLGKLRDIPNFEIVSWEVILNEGIDNIKFEEEIVIPLFLKNGRETKELREKVLKNFEQLNVSEDVREEIEKFGISFDVIRSAREFKRIGILKIDGDKVGKLFSGWLKDELKRKGYSLIVLTYLSEILQFAFKYVTLEIAEGINHSSIDNLAFVFVVYSSGDELTVVGDVEKLLEYYKKFVERKKEILFDVIRTSASLAYTHYKQPFRFIYEKINEFVELAKKEKEAANLELYLKLPNSINMQGIAIIKHCFEKWNNYVEIFKKRIIEGKLPRTRIANMEMIIEKILEELKENKASSVIYLVYYASKDYKEYFEDLLKDIKERFSLESKEKTREMLNYWLSIFDFVKTITRS